MNFENGLNFKKHSQIPEMFVNVKNLHELKYCSQIAKNVG